ncbi:MAG: sodium:proton antiporter [Schaedlerella sp.]|nr:sodium:proton antiporter [Schaedlerella sp.]
MNNFLTATVFLLAFVVFLGFFNEKVTKFTYEISLMLFSIVIGAVILIARLTFGEETTVSRILAEIDFTKLETFLMEGVLCFMLFAGSCHMRLMDFKKHAKTISLLAIGATLLGAVFYGVLFYGISALLGLNLSLPICLMFGSITAPTDPIAATSILKKFNLPSKIGFIIEGESLLNDGVGVALFVCFSGIVTAQDNGGFFAVMAKELFGAVLVGIVITALCFPIFKSSQDVTRKIFTSLLAVSGSYLACEHFEFSGAIASVVCGVLFSALRNWNEQKGHKWELENFDIFWEILDSLMNSVLYVMLGLSFCQILQMEYVLILSIAAIVINLIGRSGSVGVAALFAGALPDGYDKVSFVKLLTWGGLRGGLSVALAMSTREMVNPDIYYIILGGTYAIVFFTTIVQGMTMPKVYNKIKEGLK